MDHARADILAAQFEGDTRLLRYIDRANRDARHRTWDPCGVSWSSNCFWLACAEGDDAPDRIVRRDADGDSIARNHLDAETTHTAAELGEHFVAGIALHAV